MKAEPKHPDEVLPPVTFPRRRLAGRAGSSRCRHRDPRQPTGATAHRAPPPRTGFQHRTPLRAPHGPRPRTALQASRTQPGPARRAHLPPSPSLPQNADKAATTHLLLLRGRRRKLQVCPPPSLLPPALSLNQPSCFAPGRARRSGVPGSTSDTGDPAATAPHICQGKQTPSASGRRCPAGRIRAVNRPEGSTGAGSPRPSTGARPAVPRAHRRDVRRLRPSSPSSPGALRAGTVEAQPGARRLPPLLSALFVAVKA